jgi:hypothetical protein
MENFFDAEVFEQFVLPADGDESFFDERGRVSSLGERGCGNQQGKDEAKHGG